MAIMWDSYVPPADLTTFARAVPVNQTYILDQILPNRTDQVLEAEFAESVVTTRAAKARAWDAPPAPGERDTFMTSRVKLPAVSQMLGRGERDRLELERQRLGGTALGAIEQAIYDDTENNVRSVQARVELMRGDLLGDGIITIPEMGGMQADFGVPAEHKVTAATPWTTTATADILGDLRNWNKVYRNNNGFPFGGMIMSEDTLYTMLQNAALRTIWSNVNGTPSLLTQDQLNTTLSAYRLPPVAAVYDAQTVVDGTTVSILPHNAVIFVPPAGIELGHTQWGMTATALEFASAGVRLEPSPAGMVAVVDKDVRPPYREASYVDATVMPILSRPRGLFVATVASS